MLPVRGFMEPSLRSRCHSRRGFLSNAGEKGNGSRRYADAHGDVIAAPSVLESVAASMLRGTALSLFATLRDLGWAAEDSFHM